MVIPIKFCVFMTEFVKNIFPGMRFPGCLLLIILLSGGCATPVGVKTISQNKVYQTIDRSALNSDTYSSYTAVVLHRYAFNDGRIYENPVKIIRDLHQIACKDERRDTLLALSELCFLFAQKVKYSDVPYIRDSGEPSGVTSRHSKTASQRDADFRMFYSASAVYSYLFLLGPGSEPPPEKFDRRFRLACDLYNRSLSFVVRFKKGTIQIREGVVPLPFGQIRIFSKTPELPWNENELEEVIPADSLKIRGLSIRNRVPGLGAPIIAVRKKTPKMPVSSSVPMTIFVKVHGSVKDFEGDNLSGESTILSAGARNMIINNQTVPLEKDLTASIAYTLNDPYLWSVGRKLFRMGRSTFEPGIYPIQPYQPGLVPVVLVHGTMSSPVWWAEMLNTLNSDPALLEGCQIWLYLYDSGKPLPFSARGFQESLAGHIKKVDPHGNDPAMKDIVLIGHSQGGLLIRFASVDTGESLIKAVIKKSLDELDLSPEEKELLVKYGVFQPMPEVGRVVFISTPHRGSIRVGSFARRLARRFINLPGDVFKTLGEFTRIAKKAEIPGELKKGLKRTSIDSMAPDNPILLALSELPVPPDIKAHSIIAIKGDEMPPDGHDGVVAYKSAHLDGVESEMVVRSGHSCQQHPLVIEEVRRILLEHLKDGNKSKTEKTVTIEVK